MRKVFSSPRLENVEAVANLLRAEGIEIKIENGRSYRGYRRGNFSYDTRNAPKQIPAVWIIRAEDQPRGRQLLREIGLLESTRDGWPGALSNSRTGSTLSATGFWNGKRIRLGLLVLIGCGIALIAFTSRRQHLEHPAAVAATPAAPSAQKPAATTPLPPMLETITDTQVHRIDVPTALAVTLIDKALANRKPAVACIQIDGHDPSATLLKSLAPGVAQVFPASTCPGNNNSTFSITVHDYLTDGSGSGQVQLDLGVEDSQLVDVERHGSTWQVLRRH